MNDFNTLPNSPSIELTVSPYEPPLEVDLERFFEFSFDLAEDLLDLEATFRQQRQIRSSRTKKCQQPTVE